MNWGEITIDALRAGFGVTAAAYALAAIGLNLQFGFTGLMNFGHIASLAAGAYGVAIPMEAGVSLWPALLCGIAASVVVSLLLGLSALRLRLDYLAIATIAGGEILRLVLRSRWAEPLTQGVYGIQQFSDQFFNLNPLPIEPTDRIGIGDFSYDGRSFWVMTVCWSLVIIGTLVVWLLVKSPWGRAIKAVREDEHAARSLGKNVFLLRVQSFTIGGVFGALAGMLLAFDRNVNPDFYLVVVTFLVYAVMLVGGAGTIMGPIVGAVTYWFMFEWLDSFVLASIQEGWYGAALDESDAGQIRYVLLGLGLILLVVFRPQGILGKREEALLSES